MTGTGFSFEKLQRGCKLFLAGSTVCAAAVVHAAPPILAPIFPTCLSKGANALVSLSVKPETGWSSVRVYFRRNGSPYFYYLEMRADGKGNYWATLPRPDETTHSADIQFSVKDVEGLETRSALTTVDVTSTCNANLSPEQERFARNLVVGETITNQAGEAVVGWQCIGVVSRINVNGQLRPDAVCRALLCCAAIAKQKELVPILLAGGGIVGGVIIHEREHKEASKPRI
ncbi:MAG: hypothetical protein LAO05_18020 [Acidobacteriia bacterium]|nr:hypothetical protein [Terriglobia bacterium]